MSAEPVAGCDVELTHVTAGNIQAWSLAYAAFGPEATRRSALHPAWRTLTDSGAVPAPIDRPLGASIGYPQWLHQTIPVGPELASAPVTTACEETAPEF